MSGVARQNTINAPSTMAEEIEQVKSYGAIPTGTYVALPERPCPRCTNNLIEGMFTCMCCGYVITSSKRSERTMRIYQKRAEVLLELSERSRVRINADNFLHYWTGEDVADRAFVTWEADQIRRARQRLTRAMNGILQHCPPISSRQCVCSFTCQCEQRLERLRADGHFGSPPPTWR